MVSPTFAPMKIKFPKHIHTPLDDKFKELADKILNRSVKGEDPYTSEVSAPYEIPEYPIQKSEDKSYFERQYSIRYSMNFNFVGTRILYTDYGS